MRKTRKARASACLESNDHELKGKRMLIISFKGNHRHGMSDASLVPMLQFGKIVGTMPFFFLPQSGI